VSLKRRVRAARPNTTSIVKAVLTLFNDGV
jgi:hypothetical protein